MVTRRAFVRSAAAALLAIGGMPVAGHAGGPQGRAYVSNFDSDTISVFEIGGDGPLSLRGVVPVPSGASQPLAGGMTPDGTRLYYANFGSGDVSAFAVGAGGGLVPAGVFAPGGSTRPTNASGLAITADGRQLYTTYFNGGGAGAVAGFQINTDGSLGPIGSAIATGGDGTAGAAIDPSGRHLYVANKGSGTVSTFAIAADGRLTATDEPQAAGSGAFVLTVSPDGRRLYVANADTETVTIFTIGAGASLTRAAADVPTGAASPRGVLLTPDGGQLYVAHYNTGHNGSLPGSLASFTVERDGQLTPIGGPMPTGGNGAEALALAPDGRTLFVANFGSSTISSFALSADRPPRAQSAPVPSGGEHPDFQSIVVRGAYGTQHAGYPGAR